MTELPTARSTVVVIVGPLPLAVPHVAPLLFVSEAVFLLQSDGDDAEPVLRLLERDLIRIDFVMDEHRPDVIRLLRKSADQPMSLADACIVRMSELADASQVFTTDRDFTMYRRQGTHVIPLLAPFD